MTLPTPTYDLVLLIDPQAEDDVRAKIVADARTAIEAQGEFLRHDEWGNRVLTYPIDRKANAEYHLLQFHAGSSELLDGLDRSLRIDDDVMRFRIIKLAPGVPDAPDMDAPAAAPPRREETAGESAPPASSLTDPAVTEPAAPEAVAAEPDSVEPDSTEPAAVEPAADEAAVESEPQAEVTVGESS
jgi:small subunit ribosomal protein S6